MASEAAVVAQGLECCLCFEYFDEPKLLSCTHTFCKKCLHRLYECNPHQYQLSCPICRHITRIDDGDISKLQTNIPISAMVDDLKSAKRNCTIHAICNPEAKSPAVQYCAQCDEYMCDPCTKAHGKFKKIAKHDVVSMDDVKRGKVRVKRICTKHPDEEKLYFCTSCNVSICFRCRVIDHGKSDHEIKEVSDYKKTIQKQIESLQKKAATAIETIEAHAKLVKEQQAVVEVELDQKIAEINQSYKEAVKHLTRQRNDLIDRCGQRKASHIAQLENIKESDDQTITCIRSASELVGNGIKALLEGQTLAVHNTICCDLEKMLLESKPDVTRSNSIADIAKLVKFTKSSTSINLGDLHLPDWQLEEVSIFPLSHDDPCDAVPLPDGRVAIGYGEGEAIEMFTVDGPQGTVLRGVQVRGVSVLSDGRYIVLHNDATLTLYTQTWQRLNVEFNARSHFLRSNCYCMCVDRDDNIYAGAFNCILVFRPEGGAPLREILCNGYLPWEIYLMDHSKRLVVCETNVWDVDSVRFVDSVRVINEEGAVLHHIQMMENTCTAVLKDDSILIAYRKNDLMSIRLYTKDLKRIKTVLRDFPVGDRICKLVELPTAEIVVVSGKQFIVFRKIQNSARGSMLSCLRNV